ncbi:MAG: hypothetical protein AB7D57_14795 [Desulfovibrionaceae bacterium]
MNTRSLRSVVAVLLLAALVVGCSDKRVTPMQRPEGRLAVAGFTSPRFNYELLAGYLPDEGRSVDRDVLRKLDASLLDQLTADGVTDFAPAFDTRQCQEIVTFEQANGRKKSALAYWVEVGRCMKADYILVPQVTGWHERKGDEWTVESPASVTMDLYFISLGNEPQLVRKHFDETQRSLSEDLGNIKTFFGRGAKWLTAQELARAGMQNMLYEMGL